MVITKRTRRAENLEALLFQQKHWSCALKGGVKRLVQVKSRAEMHSCNQ